MAHRGLTATASGQSLVFGARLVVWPLEKSACSSYQGVVRACWHGVRSALISRSLLTLLLQASCCARYYSEHTRYRTMDSSTRTCARSARQKTTLACLSAPPIPVCPSLYETMA